MSSYPQGVGFRLHTRSYSNILPLSQSNKLSELSPWRTARKSMGYLGGDLTVPLVGELLTPLKTLPHLCVTGQADVDISFM